MFLCVMECFLEFTAQTLIAFKRVLQIGSLWCVLENCVLSEMFSPPEKCFWLCPGTPSWWYVKNEAPSWC